LDGGSNKSAETNKLTVEAKKDFFCILRKQLSTNFWYQQNENDENTLTKMFHGRAEGVKNITRIAVLRNYIAP
jgi:hypothetical protein